MVLHYSLARYRPEHWTKVEELISDSCISPIEWGKRSFNLTKRQIKSICELKDKQWKFGIKSQINWYNKNIKREYLC